MTKMSNEFMRPYLRERWNTRRSSAIEKLGGKCVNCGSKEMLEFDHIDPSTKLFTLSKVPFASEVRWQNELSKCQLLCHDCHKEKSSSEGSFNNDDKEYHCSCGKILISRKAYAGHMRWCKSV